MMTKAHRGNSRLDQAGRENPCLCFRREHRCQDSQVFPLSGSRASTQHSSPAPCCSHSLIPLPSNTGAFQDSRPVFFPPCKIHWLASLSRLLHTTSSLRAYPVPHCPGCPVSLGHFFTLHLPPTPHPPLTHPSPSPPQNQWI